MLSLHGMLLRLLQDDDDEIRRLASSVVSRGLGVHRPVVLAKAIEIWWEWLDNLLSSSPAIDGWIEWLWELCVDASGFGESN